MEQQEPAAGGTEGTKDETALCEFETLIIEVAELYNEVKLEKEETETEKKGEAKKSDDRQKHMQDETVKGDYDCMSPDERTGSCEQRRQVRSKLTLL